MVRSGSRKRISTFESGRGLMEWVFSVYGFDFLGANTTLESRDMQEDTKRMEGSRAPVVSSAVERYKGPALGRRLEAAIFHSRLF
jgi:hypothetical protein